MRTLHSCFILILVLLLTPLSLTALPSERPGLEEGRDGETEGPADRPLERAAWNAMLRRDAQGRLLSANRLKALGEACQMPVDPSMRTSAPDRGLAAPAGIATLSGNRWQALGPRPALAFALPNFTYGPVSGRVSAIAISPSDEATLLIASATGGIWKSTDSGANWRPVSDGAPALAISHIAYAPSNPSIVYAATGEVDGSAFEGLPSLSLGTYLGAGLLRSGDGGETWSRIDVDLPDNAILSRVLVHPADPQ